MNIPDKLVSIDRDVVFKSLYKLCLNYICDNLELYCDTSQEPLFCDQQQKEGKLFQSTESNVCNLLFCYSKEVDSRHNNNTNNKKKVYFVFKDQTLRLNSTISNDLFQILIKKSLISDSTVNLFNKSQTCLKSVAFKDTFVSKNAIKTIFSQHNINELSLINIRFNFKTYH
jgi:hypothetical protein